MSIVGVSVGSSFNVLSFVLIQKIFSIPNELSVGESVDSFSIDLHPLVDVKVMFVVMSGCRDDFAEVWIPNDYISVSPFSNDTFSRIHVEDLGGFSGSDINKLILTQKTLSNALGPDY